MKLSDKIQSETFPLVFFFIKKVYVEPLILLIMSMHFMLFHTYQKLTIK